MEKLSQKEKEFYNSVKSSHSFYLEALVDAIKFVYNNSDGYFKSTSGRERSMVFRIAHRLANQIEGEGVFVDLEPTKCNHACQICQPKEDDEGHHIIPDLIIHRRIRPGYLVAEFKCSPNKWEHDCDKLKDLTTPHIKRNDIDHPRNTPHYELGVFVYLSNRPKEVQITVFARGEKLATIAFKDIYY